MKNFAFLTKNTIERSLDQPDDLVKESLVNLFYTWDSILPKLVNKQAHQMRSGSTVTGNCVKKSFFC
jgi:hypothetical protein